MMKIRKPVSAMLSLFMALSMLGVSPVTVNADTGTDVEHGASVEEPAGAQQYAEGSIRLEDEFAIWGINDYPETVQIYRYNGSSVTNEPYKGISYDAVSNTLTLDHVTVSDAAFILKIRDMEDLTIKLVGSSSFCYMSFDNTKVSFVGDGELTLGAPLSYSRDGETHTGEYIFSGMALEANNTTFEIASTVTIHFDDVSASEESIHMLFDQQKKIEDVFVCHAEPTQELNWQYDEIDNTTTEERWVYDCYEWKELPAAEVMKLNGDESDSNYWVYTGRTGYYETDLEVRRLIPTEEGVWIGAPTSDGNAYYECGGTDPKQYIQYTDYYSGSGEYLQPGEDKRKGKQFVPYESAAELPEGMVKDGKAVVALKPLLSLGGLCYSKDEQHYIIFNQTQLDEDQIDHYFFNLYRVDEVGEYHVCQYLGELEELHVNGLTVEPDENEKYIYNGTEYQNKYDAEHAKYQDFLASGPQYMADHGYEKEMIVDEKPMTYSYVLPMSKFSIQGKPAGSGAGASDATETSTQAGNTTPEAGTETVEAYYEETTEASTQQTTEEVKEEDRESLGYIRVEEGEDEDYQDCEVFNGFYDPMIFETYKGMSFDLETRTLTLDNVDGSGITMMCDNMADMDFKVVGNCTLKTLKCWGTRPTFTGNGTLTIEEGLEVYGFENWKNQMKVGPDVTVTLKKSEEGASALFTRNCGENGIEAEELAKLISYEGDVSEELKWDMKVDGLGVVEEQEKLSGIRVRTTFPATEILKKKEYEGNNNYYIKSISHVGNQPMIYHHISQLVEKDGYWYEMDDGQNYWNKDYLFEAYTEDEISTLPSTLVNAEGIATAYLATQQDYGCEVYTKNGVTYVFSHEGRVRNLIVDPVTPAESAYDRETAPFVMMKLTRRYHSIPVNFVTISEEYNVTQSGDKAVRDQFMKDNGYAVKTTLVDYGYTANCCLVNDAITFKPKTEEPATEAGKTEASTGEAGKTEAPTGEAGKTEAPTGEEGKTEAPTGEEGKTEAPTGEEGKTEAPTGEADKTEAPATEAPKTEAPATEAPKTEAPATVAPTTQEAAKKANPMKVSVKNKTLKLKKLKKKAQTVKAITVKNAQGKVSYKLTDVPDKVKKLVKINSKGVITFKNWKKAKKGTYSIEVEITAKGNSKYESVTVTKLVKIKVK